LTAQVEINSGMPGALAISFVLSIYTGIFSGL
jgi:hypothetical protein